MLVFGHPLSVRQSRLERYAIEITSVQSPEADEMEHFDYLWGGLGWQRSQPWLGTRVGGYKLCADKPQMNGTVITS